MLTSFHGFIGKPQSISPTLYRIPITVSGSTDGALSNYQVQITLSYNAHMQTDFSDIRFRDSDASTSIDFWLESKTDSTTATFWVEVPSIPADPSTVVIYAYYGDTEAAGGSSIFDTFVDGDDFDRTYLHKYPIWTKYGSNPIISDGTYSYGDPGVYYESGTWYLYLDKWESGTLHGITLFTSSDGISFTEQGEVISLGSGGSWDDYWVADPCVLKVGSTYHMWYSGCDGTTLTGIKIGHATASDPAGTWTKDGSNPVFSVASSGANEPSVIYDPSDSGKEFKMLYTYDNTGGTATDVDYGDIGYAYSTDGTSWTAYNTYLTGKTWQDQLQFLDNNGLWQIFVNYTDSQLYRTVSRSLHQTTTFSVPGALGGLSKGTGGDWDVSEALAPSIVEVSGTYYMYYQSSGKIGLATATSVTSEWLGTNGDSYIISSNQAYKADGPFGAWSREERPVAKTPPYIMECDINLNAHDGSNFMGGLYVAKDATYNYHVLFQPATNYINLYGITDAGTGAPAWTDEQNGFAVDLSTDYKIRATTTASGITIDFYDDSWHNAILSGSGLTLTDAYLGFVGFSTSVNRFYADNYRVRKYASDVPGVSVGIEE